MSPSKLLIPVEALVALLCAIGGIVAFSFMISDDLKSIACDKHLIYLSSLPGEPCNVTAISHTHQVSFVWAVGQGTQYTSSQFAHALHIGQVTQCYGDDTQRVIQRVATIDNSDVVGVVIYVGLSVLLGLVIIVLVTLMYRDLRNSDFSRRGYDTLV